MLPISDDLKREIVDALFGLTGRERAEVVRTYAMTYGISAQAISAIARKAGLRATATRRDRGTSSIARAEAITVAAAVAISKRMDGRMPMTVKESIRLLRMTGQLDATAAYSTFCRELRRHDVSKADLRRPTPYRSRATAHPNAEWQIDFTACTQYYFDDNGFQEREIAMQLHKNHPAEFRSIRRHLWRVAAIDHYSGAFFFQYVYAAGESAHDAINFLIAAMQPKDHPAYRFHGIPDQIFADKGSFAKSAMAKRFCERFKIDLKTHMPGNPRAKGSVEGLLGHLEIFDARLKLDPPRNEEDLNRRAFEYGVEANCTRPFRESIDPRGFTRMQYWSAITPEQLFIPPPPEECWAILRTGAARHKVKLNGRLRYKRHFYHVPDSNCWDKWVEICYNPRAYPEVEVTWRDQEDGHVRAVWSLRPLGMAGAFLEDCVRPGEIRRPAATRTQQAMTEIEQVAAGWGVRYKGYGEKRIALPARAQTETLASPAQHRPEWFGHDADAAEKLATRTAPGTRRDPINPAAERRLTVMGLLGELAESLGRPLTRDENARIRAAWPEGCRMSEIDAIADGLHGGRREGHDARQIGAG